MAGSPKLFCDSSFLGATEFTNCAVHIDVRWSGLQTEKPVDASWGNRKQAFRNRVSQFINGYMIFRYGVLIRAAPSIIYTRSRTPELITMCLHQLRTMK